MENKYAKDYRQNYTLKLQAKMNKYAQSYRQNYTLKLQAKMNKYRPELQAKLYAKATGRQLNNVRQSYRFVHSSLELLELIYIGSNISPN